MNSKTYPEIKNKEQCLDAINMLQTIKETPDNKKMFNYISYVSINFFAENIKDFNEKEIKEIFSNEVFLEKMPITGIKYILEKMVERKEVFPFLIPKWFNPHKITKNILRSYFDILCEKNVEDQLLEYYRKNKETVKEFFRTDNANWNPILKETYLRDMPQEIVYNQNWSEKKVLAFLEKNIESIDNLESLVILKNQMTFKSNEVDYKIYDIILKLVDKKEVLDEKLLRKIKKMDIDFLTYGKLHYPEIMNKLLSSPISVSHSEEDEFERKIEIKYHLNFLQYAIEEAYEKTEELRILYHLNKELIKSPIIKEIYFAQIPIDITHYFIKTKNKFYEILLEDKKSLTELQKNIAISKLTYYSLEKETIPEFFLECDKEIFNTYANIIIENTHSDKLKKQIEMKKFKDSLEEDLSINSIIKNQVKL